MGITGMKLIQNIIVTIWGTKKSFEFEKEGTIMGRGNYRNQSFKECHIKVQEERKKREKESRALEMLLSTDMTDEDKWNAMCDEIKAAGLVEGYY